MTELGLQPRDALVLLTIRATYVVQLLVAVVEPSATSLKNLFKSFTDQSQLKLLAELDACLITGVANFCDVWTSALAHLNEEAAGQLDIGKILKHHEVKSITSDGKSRSASGGSCDGLDEEVNQTDDEIRQFFGINELITFKLHPTNGVLPIDEQQSLMWAVQMKLLSLGRLGETCCLLSFTLLHGCDFMLAQNTYIYIQR